MAAEEKTNTNKDQKNVLDNQQWSLRELREIIGKDLEQLEKNSKLSYIIPVFIIKCNQVCWYKNTKNIQAYINVINMHIVIYLSYLMDCLKDEIEIFLRKWSSSR
jgi:hypothetical protein